MPQRDVSHFGAPGRLFVNVNSPADLIAAQAMAVESLDTQPAAHRGASLSDFQ
jgi:hypothetical protein